MNGISLMICAVGLFAGVLLPEAASAEDYQCPQTINVAENVTQLPQGWKSVINNGTRHAGYMSLSGPDGITIREDVEEDRPDGWKLLWVLKYIEGERFVKCEYGNSGIIVVRKIPNNLEYCELTKTTANGLDRSHMHCGR